jgi:RimJ/RimL family protein N-acetyltransferase
VFKVHHERTRALVQAIPGCTRTQTYLTYSTPPGYRPSAPAFPTQGLRELTPEAQEFFAHNGYSPEELAAHFSRGAAWFRTLVNGRTVSACFIFPNYQHIWEVAGVYTPPEHRQKGYARSTVQAALTALLGTGRTPRYQFRADNVASRAVAESLGLRCVLVVDHYVSPRQSAPPRPEEASQGAA